MPTARRRTPGLQRGDSSAGGRARASVSLNSIGVLFLAAVIVLAATPAVLATSLHDPVGPISRVGSQLRRIAAAVPVRLVSKAPKREEHWPIDARPETDLDAERAAASLASSHPLAGPLLARLGVQLTDLPPPGVCA